MNRYSFIFIAVIFAGCVQETRKVTVEYNLLVQGIDSIQTVGVRGRDKPLDWSGDFPLEPIVKDSLFRTYVTYTTGYSYTEIKFVVNDSFELYGLDNRRVMFSETDTTTYTAIYNIRND